MSDELRDDEVIGKLHIGNGISNVPGSWDVPLYVENLTPEARRWLEIGKRASDATRLAFNDGDPQRQAAYLVGLAAGKKQAAGLAAFGCKHLIVTPTGDGGTQYGCALLPGAVRGSENLVEHDEPLGCERKETQG